MPNPKFSIITVTYNAADVLERTIKSVIAQSYNNYEYILIDGQSKDNTMDIVNQYRNYFAQIVSEPDHGIYDAMNKATRLATGDFLCFLNAGDKLHDQDTLKLAVYSIHGNKLPDIIYGETIIVNKKEEIIGMRRLSAPSSLRWTSFKTGMRVCHQAFWANKEKVVPYNLTYRFSADFDWCIRVMKRSKVMHNTHLILIDYLKEGATTYNHKASLNERFRVMSHHYGLFTTILCHFWFVVRLMFKKVV